MSLISKEHFSMLLKSIKKLLSQKADKSDIVQSDWSQNDETRSDYVKNRTHYEYHEVLWQHTFTESDIQLGNYFSADTSPIDLKRGNTYIVEVDGVSVECITYEEYGSGFIKIEAEVGGIRVVISNNYSTDNGTRYNALASKTCTVVLKAPTVHRLDEKYIPDSIARIADVDNDIADLAQRLGVFYYGTCPSAVGTSAKVVSLHHSSTNFKLKTGVIVCVKFTFSNINYYMTLDVNSTGAKQIRISNDTFINQRYWQAGSYVTFLYDGIYWNIISIASGPASGTYYGLVKLSSSVSSSLDAGTAATPSAVKQAYDKAAAALPKSGGTMTGDLTLKGDPTSELHAATKQYVDNAIDGIDIPEQVQADWNQSDETAVDFIKNKPNDESALELVMEMGLVEPAAAEDGSIYTDENGAMYSL